MTAETVLSVFSLHPSLLEAPCGVPVPPFDVCKGTLELSVLGPLPLQPSSSWPSQSSLPQPKAT